MKWVMMSKISKVQLVLTLSEDGTYSSSVLIDDQEIGSGPVIGGFPAAFEVAQAMLWEYDTADDE